MVELIFLTRHFLFYPATGSRTDFGIFPGSKNSKIKNFGGSGNYEAQNFLNYLKNLKKYIKKNFFGKWPGKMEIS